MRRAGGKAAVTGALALTLGHAATMGCASYANLYDCGAGDVYQEGCPALPDAGADAALPECPGPCVPGRPLDWSSPVLLWIGASDSAPPCPEGAPVLGYEGHAGLGDAPELVCPTCSCETPSIACELPTHWMTSDQVCPGDGALSSHVVFDAPLGWDGSCTTDNAIPAGAGCISGGCVESLTIDPPVAKSGKCAPKAQEPAGLQDIKWTWAVEGRACTMGSYPPCSDYAETCAPPHADGFMMCIYREEEHECPPDWPVKQVLYEGVEDTRACSECACGEVEGAGCTVAATAYSDSACSVIAAQAPMSSGHEGGYCVPPIMSSTALGSKSASITSLDPGSCKASGGALSGTVGPSRPSTFCCGG